MFALLSLIASTAFIGHSDTSQPRSFAPGVRIHWVERHVELDAEIVLRQGPLELLACSPKTREHESIFVVAAEPLKVFQAMGLIGLEPGHPIRYDEKNDRWTPPKGHDVSIEARCLVEGVERVIPSERLVRLADTQKPPANLNWVFAGSRSMPDGRFGANLDGTVISVVDFETALITLGSLHSADNEQLWLEANPDQIPPLGTKCHLRIRDTAPTDTLISVDLQANGTLRLGGSDQDIEVAELAKRFTSAKSDDSKVWLVLRPQPGVPTPVVEAARAKIIEAGVPPERIRVVPAPPPPP